MAQKEISLGTKAALATLGVVGAALMSRQIQRRARRMDVRSRVVLITGASRGLGLALAREFADLGANVALCARDADELRAAESDIRSRGGRVTTFQCDLHEKADIVKLVRDVETQLGPIDILVNNAGTILVGPFSDMTEADFQDAMAVNFWPAVQSTFEVAPAMVSRGQGRIVNIASVGGRMPVPHLLPYCASKFALVGFSSGLRSELIQHGVRVTTVVPGLMRTGSPTNASFKGNHQAEYTWFALGDSTPGLSMHARRAARKIVDAAIHGDSFLTLGMPAKLGALLFGITPRTFLQISSWVNRLLPGPTGGSSKKFGRESESPVTRSPLMYFGRRAERQYNQPGAAGDSSGS